MATIKDVAKHAGVSTTTVSHVINKTRFVADDTKAAVWAAIKELSYSPSAVARSLKVNNTKTIGLLATSSGSPYYAEVIQAVEAACYQKGYTLILCNTQNDLEKQQAYLAMLAQKRVDGLLVMCSEYHPPLLSLLQEYPHIPMMVMDWGKHSDFTDNIEDNGFQGGYLATRYLIDRGHREIATITGQLNEFTGRERHKGFLHALKEAGITIPDEWIIEADFQPQEGYDGMMKILNTKQRPTALFCGGDVIAMGALCAAGEMGLRVPDDISVIGYDNIRNTRYYNPPLTTIQQPKESLAEMALDMLLDRIINKRETYHSIELHPELVERNSVADGPYLNK
ncbi:HTH-type transcriptional repressor PurR [Pragia fontium]|uniref:Transcriptional regulator, LacI family n=2 Tax=Pragia fontium TaxID=82985 RepID=A0AAJ4W9G3_9GAMM|nr:HTH-type transcriptional repressor PurR [Pragia fontium]GKX61881.1 HTH-type transcriptional repressor PurR [Pragia fontium]SFC48196.1 transcriptional regulator, LacI family [Pragia fontium DSM 5563 = ATCC 49100]SUB82323.1 Purine nucleotide synthesis repressor [Pragia fontium]VEJ55171.1 Purine nucleotide synthesis repressor [Pragia fontium]